jgi:hypothetical protein
VSIVAASLKSTSARASTESACSAGDSKPTLASPSAFGPSIAPRPRKTATTGTPLLSRAPESSDATTMTTPMSAIVPVKRSTGER